MYSPRTIQRTLQQHNIFFVGDSTARQNFATMLHISRAAAEKVTDIVPQALKTGINMNRGKITHTCKERDTSNHTVRGQLWGETFFFCFDTTSASPSSSSHRNTTTHDTKRGKFDYASRNCPSDIDNLVEIELDAAENNKRLVGFTHEYDTIVVEIGIWEIEKQKACSTCCPNTTSLNRMRKALESIHRLSSESNQVVWKTFGPSAYATKDLENRRRTDELNAATRAWFRDNRPTNMHLLDFDLQIGPRSLGRDRITGDSEPHWGVEARTLSAQMLTHILVTIDGYKGKSNARDNWI